MFPHSYLADLDRPHTPRGRYKNFLPPDVGTTPYVTRGGRGEKREENNRCANKPTIYPFRPPITGVLLHRQAKSGDCKIRKAVQHSVSHQSSCASPGPRGGGFWRRRHKIRRVTTLPWRELGHGGLQPGWACLPMEPLLCKCEQGLQR